MKKIFVLGFFLLFMLPIKAQETQAPEKIYIPVISKKIDSSFFQLIKLGTEQAAKAYGIETTWEGQKVGEPAEVQLNLLKSALSKNPQAIILTALNSQEVSPYLEEANAADIPVVGLDTGVDNPIVKTTVATDNYKASTFAAEKMGQFLNGKGKVGIISLDRISTEAEARTNGFIDTLKQNFPDIEILPPQYDVDSVASAKEAAKSFLTAHPDLTGLYGQSGDISTGIIEAVRELNKEGEVTIIGFDASKTLSNAIKEGTVAGAVSQDPIGMGYLAIQAALRAYRGETLPDFIDSGFFWYDKSNIDNPEVQLYLFD
ncbi:MAG: LacI family transcriptional regulator [Clostridia bacterium]|jgi:ribose transport system substrate-binding protein|nr:LacI family transcriptional regulator [Clostridia bacterium]